MAIRFIRVSKDPARIIGSRAVRPERRKAGTRKVRRMAAADHSVGKDAGRDIL